MAELSLPRLSGFCSPSPKAISEFAPQRYRPGFVRSSTKLVTMPLLLLLLSPGGGGGGEPEGPGGGGGGPPAIAVTVILCGSSRAVSPLFV